MKLHPTQPKKYHSQLTSDERRTLKDMSSVLSFSIKIVDEGREGSKSQSGGLETSPTGADSK